MVVYTGLLPLLVYLFTSLVFHDIWAMEDPKCPKTCPEEEPDLCVRVKESGKGTYTSMSLCDFERVRCRKDVKTMIVPLKFCYARNDDEAIGKIESTQTGEVKGEVERPFNSAEEIESRGEKKTSALIKPTRTQKLGLRKRHKRSVDESRKEEGKTTAKVIKPTRTQKRGLKTELRRRRRSIHNGEQKKTDNRRWYRRQDPCARQCPVRNKMVCARCMHGVARTFMSECHLREHQCRFRRDRLELVARRPCIMSGPYLELPRPVAAAAEPGDLDPVLEHIYSVLNAQGTHNHGRPTPYWTKSPRTGRKKIPFTMLRTRDVRP